MEASTVTGKFKRGTRVIVNRRANTRELGVILTLNPSGSYGIRLDSGKIVEAARMSVSAFYETDRYTGREV